MLVISYPNDGRKLRYFINVLLKSRLATEIKRFNYVKSYKIVDKKIVKFEEKILLILFDKEKKDKLVTMIKKQHPEKEDLYFIKYLDGY